MSKKNGRKSAKTLAGKTTREWLSKVNPDYRDTQGEVKAGPTDHWMYYSSLGGADSRITVGSRTPKRG
jgi:hypothetical protein